MPIYIQRKKRLSLFVFPPRNAHNFPNFSMKAGREKIGIFMTKVYISLSSLALYNMMTIILSHQPYDGAANIFLMT